jgi:hypothetical protein
MLLLGRQLYRSLLKEAVALPHPRLSFALVSSSLSESLSFLSSTGTTTSPMFASHFGDQRYPKRALQQLRASSWLRKYVFPFVVRLVALTPQPCSSFAISKRPTTGTSMHCNALTRQPSDCGEKTGIALSPYVLPPLLVLLQLL